MADDVWALGRLASAHANVSHVWMSGTKIVRTRGDHDLYLEPSADTSVIVELSWG
jgi:hypothetical protein